MPKQIRPHQERREKGKFATITRTAAGEDEGDEEWRGGLFWKSSHCWRGMGGISSIRQSLKN